MRAIYLVEPGKLEVRDVAPPTPEPGEIIVRVECALTCGTDLKAFKRGHPFIPMPGRFGHQYTGRVEALGPGVSSFRLGDPIIGVHSGPCGQCDRCRASRPNLCTRLSEQLVLGAFAEQLRITPRVVRANIHARPEGMSPTRAAFVEPVSCVVHALRLIDFRGADRVLVLGLGSMGLLFLQLLKFFTNASIVGAGRRAERVKLAAGYGIERAIDLEIAPLDQALEGNPDFDIVIECTGQSAGWEEAIRRTRPGGQTMLFGGLPKGSTFPVDTYHLHYDEIRLLGCFHFTPDDMRESVGYLTDESLRVEEMLAGEVGLDRLGWALDEMASGRGIKFAIRP